MYLSRLELHGFKSFAQKTTLVFDDGVTCIVGPNGSGKSNIVDAVRWVIGEQRARALRSEKMENVIFNGSRSRKALGLAEVKLTVENTRGVLPVEFTEVTVGRRLYRSGESEYLLNSQPAACATCRTCSWTPAWAPAPTRSSSCRWWRRSSPRTATTAAASSRKPRA